MKAPSAIRIKAIGTPTPIPAFAAEDRPEEGVGPCDEVDVGGGIVRSDGVVGGKFDGSDDGIKVGGVETEALPGVNTIQGTGRGTTEPPPGRGGQT